MNNGHPKGLYLLFATEMAERFSYYGMRALFVLYLVAAFFTNDEASQIYGSYTGLVYLTPLLGGYISDRYWGNRRSIVVGGTVMAVGQFLMFASACFVNQSIMSEGGGISQGVNNQLSLWLMFAGLAALIIGNGFFKPNISTMVGDLYDPYDQRKDSAFTIFYMGINVGAFIAPLICGPLGNGNWMNPGGFKWGFFAAGCAMLVSVLVFVTLKDRYLVTPEGKMIGGKPVARLTPNPSPKERGGISTPKTKNIAANSGTSYYNNIRLVGCIIVALAVMIFSLWQSEVIQFSPLSLREGLGVSLISAAIYGVSIGLPIFIITDGGLTKVDKMHIGVIYIIAVFVIFFWSAFEQAGSSLTIIADQQCDRHVGGFEVPTTWFQSINPIIVVTFAPIMAMLWEFLLKRGMNVPSTVKQALGLGLLSLGYIVIAWGTYGIDSLTKISMWWLVVLYFLHTIGELSLSPIGLSLVNRLSPVHLASLLMGVWFMSNATANILAGQFATLLPAPGKTPASVFGMEIVTLSDFFIFFACTAGAASIILLCLCPMLNRMMKPVIVFATNNEHKLSEVKQILGNRFEILSLKDINCFEELPETHLTLEENSIEKARYVHEHYGYDCFADDTGLEVEALNGAPGVYSARYANCDDSDTVDGKNRWGQQTADHDSQANMRKLLAKMKEREEEKGATVNRKARFRTVISLIFHNEEYFFEGIVNGEIAREKRGSEGFGYDPLFMPEEKNGTLTFAEMSDKEKNAISHRGRAIKKLVNFFTNK
ncbi:MAG: RdgB/HAM1 family non-canonical purine NTP pyrophosphatase [Prevotella sp.]|nr:RdgB/HAM1 family non-canonical purine NTP pyrophosphatase [Prevotella sp.]